MNETNFIDGVNYGPLASLAGRWEGDKGKDLAPEPDGEQEPPYHETLTFEAIGDVTNAESQTLSVLRYHQVVSKKSDNQIFHDETGYWMWDPKTDTIMHSLVIPRGVCVLAGGKANSAGGPATVLDVKAVSGDKDWGIIQSPFMQEKAKTVEFRHNISIEGDELTYSETTVLEIYSKTFDHTDSNTLKRG
jgi:hypothetical protein